MSDERDRSSSVPSQTTAVAARTSTRPPPVELDDILLEEETPAGGRPPAVSAPPPLPSKDGKDGKRDGSDPALADRDKDKRESTKERAAGDRKSARPKMTLRIPDDQVARPNLPPVTPPSEPNVRIGDLKAQLAARAAAEAEPAPAAPPAVPAVPAASHDAETTVQMPALTSGMLPDLPEDSWTPHMPTVADRLPGGERAAARASDVDVEPAPPTTEEQSPPSDDIPVVEDIAGEAFESKGAMAATLVDAPAVEAPPSTPPDPPTTPVLPTTRDDHDRVTSPGGEPMELPPRSLELGPEDIVAVDSSPRVRSPSSPPPPPRAKAPSAPPPAPPSPPSPTSPPAAPPPMRPKAQSVPPEAPKPPPPKPPPPAPQASPVAPPVATGASTPAPPPVAVVSAPVGAPSTPAAAPAVVAAPAAVVSAASVASVASGASVATGASVASVASVTSGASVALAPAATSPSTPARQRAPSSPMLIVTPSTSTSGLLAPPPMNEAAAQRKRTRPWWEELFNDDFLRASEKLTDRQIFREVDFIEDSLGVVKGATVLDLACGTGRHAIELTRRGYQVVGFDLSLPMLARAAEEAEERAASLNFVQGDMREMTFEETFDGVYCWNTSFGYFEEEKNAQVITRVHRALKKGGQFLLDVANRDFLAHQSPSLVWFEGDGCICMDEMQVDWITSRLRVKRTMMMDDGRSKEIEYSIRVYALHELGRLLHDHGFRVAEVSGRTATPGVFFGAESPRTLILAEKR